MLKRIKKRMRPAIDKARKAVDLVRFVWNRVSRDVVRVCQPTDRRP